MLDYTHNPWLVAASLAVALMAGFSGLSLTRGASAQAVPQRKLTVVVAAVVLGGGIWSMHFVAMLGLQLPILFYYDGLITLISALVAILMVGLALLILHFWPRSRRSIALAGCIVGTGIAAMHYIGMLGMEICRPVFGFVGVGLSVLAALAFSTLAISVAYGARTHRNILLGTVCFGVSVFAVHFFAMAGTGFRQLGDPITVGPMLSNEALAMSVALAAFAISGAFLLTGVSFLEPPSIATAGPARAAEVAMVYAGLPEQNTEPPIPAPAQSPTAAPHPTTAPPTLLAPPPTLSGGAAPSTDHVRVPFEREGRTHFADAAAIAVVRAEGHYTHLFIGKDKLFCPWSISEAAQRLASTRFLRTHRSYLVNPVFVSAFERTKDTGVCLLDSVESVKTVPVSRARLQEVRGSLGI